MRSTTVTVLDSALRHSPVHAYFRRRHGRGLAVLAYHGVDDPEQFDRHLDRLAAHAHPVSLADALSAFHGGPALPENATLVTFDDGAPSVLRDGAPLLRRHGIPAVAFVVPGVLDSDAPLWWDEATRLFASGARVRGSTADSAGTLVRWMKSLPDAERLAALGEMREQQAGARLTSDQLTGEQLSELEAAGVAVENHTWSHPLLDRCDADTVREELVRSHDWLTRRLGRTPRAFAYPNGNWDERAERLLTDLGYEAAFLFDHRVSERVPEHPLRVSRVRVDSTTSSARFDLIVSGLHPALHRLRGGH